MTGRSRPYNLIFKDNETRFGRYQTNLNGILHNQFSQRVAPFEPSAALMKRSDKLKTIVIDLDGTLVDSYQESNLIEDEDDQKVTDKLRTHPGFREFTVKKGEQEEKF